MNLLNIIQEIEKVDPEFQDRISPRRAAIKNITSFGSKVAVAALPFAVATMFKKAYGQAPTSVNDVLNFALSLEYLESSYYNTAMAKSGFVEDSGYIQYIQNDENHHVTFLQTVLGSAAMPMSAYGFDYTGGGGTNAGPFADVFTNYQTFLAVAETFEDTGVRAYKGQAGNLANNMVVLTAALSIHAVEARHASALRYLRASKYGVGIYPWITSSLSNGNDTGISAVDPNYNGSTPESTVVQAGVNITTLPSVESPGSTAVGVATAAFDEPLTMAEVTAAVKGFVYPK